MDHVIRWFTIFAPITLVCLWGTIYAIRKMKRVRKPAMLVIVGLGIMFVFNVLFRILMNTVSVPQMSYYIGDIFAYRWVQDGTTILWLCSQAIGVAIIVYAVFVGRDVPQSD